MRKLLFVVVVVVVAFFVTTMAEAQGWKRYRPDFRGDYVDAYYHAQARQFDPRCVPFGSPYCRMPGEFGFGVYSGVGGYGYLGGYADYSSQPESIEIDGVRYVRVCEPAKGRRLKRILSPILGAVGEELRYNWQTKDRIIGAGMSGGAYALERDSYELSCEWVPVGGQSTSDYSENRQPQQYQEGTGSWYIFNNAGYPLALFDGDQYIGRLKVDQELRQMPDPIVGYMAYVVTLQGERVPDYDYAPWRLSNDRKRPGIVFLAPQLGGE